MAPVTVTTADGEQVSIRQARWVIWDPDGEAVGSMYTTPYIRSSVARAAVAFWESRKEAKERLDEGYRLELISRERWDREIYPRFLSPAGSGQEGENV